MGSLEGNPLLATGGCCNFLNFYHHSTLAVMIEGMVGAAGIEPATLGLEIRCSIRLSYAPIGNSLNSSILRFIGF